MNLEDREWKEFKIGDTFNTDKGIYLHKKNITEGNNPYVSAKTGNNGVCEYIGNEPLFQGNLITVEKVKFSAYYQPHPFYCSHDVSVLESPHLSKYSALFISHMIMKQGDKYSYGRQAQLNVTNRQSILLPIDESGNLDYKFMESYVREQEQQKIQSYLDYCTKQLQELGSFVNIDKIEDKDWKEFFVSDIFDTSKRGKRIISDNYVDGNMAVVSSAGGNNGVIAFAGNTENVRIYGDCLSVANGGVSAGFAFYHPYDFIATDHVTHFKGDCLNKYHYLFLATIIKNQMHEKYDFSREMTDPRLQREKVIVPVNSDGKPDYYYMEQYEKNLMIKKYRQYLDYVQVTT